MASFASSLADNTVLSSLYLHDNTIGDEGLSALAAALKSNGVLDKLRLYSNTFGDGGGVALAEALGHGSQSALTTLYLWNNAIGAATFDAFVLSLKTNPALVDVDFGDAAPPGVVEAIGKSMERNRAYKRPAANEVFVRPAADGGSEDGDGSEEKPFVSMQQVARHLRSSEAQRDEL